jgi:hypothetical protein
MQLPQPRYLQAWIIFFAVTTVAGAIAGAVAGSLVGLALKDSSVPRTLIVVASAIAGLLASAPISFFTFKWAVRTVLIEPLAQQQAGQRAA